jgi:hypothetical protein
MIRLVLLAVLSIPLVASADAQSHRAAAYELLDAARAASIVDVMKVQVDQTMRRAVSDSQLTAAQQAVIDKYALKASEEVARTMEWTRLKEEFATLYVSVYTEAELRELTTFYKSALGQKMLDKMPQLLQQSMQLAQRHLQESMPRLQKIGDEMVEEMKRLRK